MGCCSLRSSAGLYTKDEIRSYISNLKASSLKCEEIKKIDENLAIQAFTVHSYHTLRNSSTYTPLFELLALNGYVTVFELKTALLLISEDSLENKFKLFQYLTKNQDRLIMQFLE